MKSVLLPTICHGLAVLQLVEDRAEHEVRERNGMKLWSSINVHTIKSCTIISSAVFSSETTKNLR